MVCHESLLLFFGSGAVHRGGPHDPHGRRARAVVGLFVMFCVCVCVFFWGGVRIFLWGGGGVRVGAGTLGPKEPPISMCDLWGMSWDLKCFGENPPLRGGKPKKSRTIPQSV